VADPPHRLRHLHRPRWPGATRLHQLFLPRNYFDCARHINYFWPHDYFNCARHIDYFCSCDYFTYARHIDYF
jgi:hypothetical protein